MTVVFFLAVPLSTGLGALVSAPFLAMEGILGLHGGGGCSSPRGFRRSLREFSSSTSSLIVLKMRRGAKPERTRSSRPVDSFCQADL